VHDIKVLKKRFAELIEEARASYLRLIVGKSHDKAVETILEYFMDEETRHEYYTFFKGISNIYEILSPDAFLRPYIDDYETLTRIFKILREAFEPGIAIDKEFARKTARLVQKHTKSGTIKPALEIYEINEETLKKIEESKVSDTEKVFNLLKGIIKTVKDDAEKSPFLISIGERAEEIAELFKQRQLTTQKALEDLKQIVEEINNARREQTEKGIPSEVFSVFWLFKKEGIEKPEEKANQMKEVFEKYPYWRISKEHEREVTKQLYKIVVKSGIKNFTEVVKKVMRVLTGRSK